MLVIVQNAKFTGLFLSYLEKQNKGGGAGVVKIPHPTQIRINTVSHKPRGEWFCSSTSCLPDLLLFLLQLLSQKLTNP